MNALMAFPGSPCPAIDVRKDGGARRPRTTMDGPKMAGHGDPALQWMVRKWRGTETRGMP